MTSAVGEIDVLEQRAADAHGYGAFHLVGQVFGIDDGAAFEGFHHAHHFHSAVGHRDFGAGGDVAALFRAGGQAEAAARAALALLQPKRSAAAVSTSRSRSLSRFLRRNSSGSMATPWASSSMYAFAHEVIGGGGQAAVGALAQGRLGRGETARAFRPRDRESADAEGPEL